MSLGLAPTPYGYSDAAKRVSDAVTLALLTDPSGTRDAWMAFSLSDGRTDGVRYPDPATAANFQLHYQQCMYIKVPWSGMTPREAEVMLRYHRRVYDNGERPPYLQGYVPVVPKNLEEL